MVNLNDNLMPVDSPIAQNQGLLTAMEFDAKNDPVSKIRSASIGSAQIQDASVTSAKIGTAAINDAQIGTISFNKSTGGTATLGGTTNGNGVLSIKDAGGTERVRADNTGVVITDGALTFVDSSGGTVVDSSGLVSTTAFGVQTATITGGSTTSAFDGAGYVSAPGGTISLARARTTTYLIGMTVNCQNNSFNSESALFRFKIGGTQYGPDILQAGANGTSNVFMTNQNACGVFIQSLAAGTSNLILEYATSGAGTAIINNLNVNQLFAVRLGN